MFFKDISKKMNLIQEATQFENSIDKLGKKLKQLDSEEKKIEEEISNKEAKIKKNQIKLNKLKLEEKEWSAEILVTKSEIQHKQSTVRSLRKKWDELSSTEQKLRKYFGDLL